MSQHFSAVETFDGNKCYSKDFNWNIYPAFISFVNVYTWLLEHLLLSRGVLSLFCGFSGFLGALSGCTGSNTGTVDSVEGGEFLFVFLNCAEFNDWSSLDNWHDRSGQLRSQLAFFLGSFTLAQLSVLVHWEEDELVLIFLQTLNVLLTGFNRLVATTTINRNANGASESSSQSSGLVHKDKLVRVAL